MPHAYLPVAVHIILKKDNKVFLIKRCNTDFKDNLWSVPAGRLEKGETLTQSALREAQEETGVKIDVSNLSKPLIMHHRDERGERIYAFFICDKWVGEPRNIEKDKCSKVGWFHIEELPNNMIKHVKNAIIAMNSGETYLEFGF